MTHASVVRRSFAQSGVLTFVTIASMTVAAPASASLGASASATAIVASAQTATPAAAPVPASPSAPSAGQNQGPRPAVRAEKTTHDFGVVGLGTDPEIEFPIVNSGTAPLDIKVTFVPRGLRLVRLDKTIAPGASGAVRLAVDTFQAGGVPEWHVSVLTNDPAHGALDLTIRADVRAYLVLTPPSARFSFVQYGPEGGTTHVLTIADDSATELLGVDSPIDYIKATTRELSAAERLPEFQGKQWQIALTISPDAPVGPIGGYVIIRTTHPHQPRAFLPVSGFVRPLFAVTPPTVDLQGVTVSADDTRPMLALVVKNFATEPIEITGVSSDITGLDAKLIAVDPGHAWRVELRLTAALPNGPFTGTLTLKTASTKVPYVKVPIQGSRIGTGAK
jgi:hypothetical protein